MKQLALLSTLLALGLAQAADMPKFEFKGVSTDTTLEELKSGGRYRCSAKNSDGFDHHCFLDFSYKETIAGVQADFVSLLTLNGKVIYISVTIPSTAYLRIKSALEEKYGPGKSTETTVKNRMGAEFDNPKTTWTNKTATMSIEKRASKVSEGQFKITSTTNEQEIIKRTNENAKTNAKAL